LVLEGHGRETELFTDVDLSHTVGWFTTQYPLHVHLAKAWDPGSLLKQVKEQIRRVPGKGIGYGVLRYLRAEHTLAAQDTPPVLFNYMGQFERALPASDLFSLAQPLMGGYSPRNRRTHGLEVNTFVRGDQLQINIDFDTGSFSPRFVQAHVNTFLNRLEELIAHCLSPEAGGHTPSDFALTDMTDEQFGRLSDLLNQLDES
jgi:non-ribosomal peptide synthase protein (TIGR01720 family)